MNIELIQPRIEQSKVNLQARGAANLQRAKDALLYPGAYEPTEMALTNLDIVRALEADTAIHSDHLIRNNREIAEKLKQVSIWATPNISGVRRDLHIGTITLQAERGLISDAIKLSETHPLPYSLAAIAKHQAARSTQNALDTFERAVRLTDQITNGVMRKKDGGLSVDSFLQPYIHIAKTMSSLGGRFQVAAEQLLRDARDHVELTVFPQRDEFYDGKSRINYDYYPFYDLVRASAEIGDFAAAKQLLTDIGHHRDPRLDRDVTVSLLERGLIDDALALNDQNPDALIQAEVRSMAAVKLMEAGRPRDAKATAREAQKILMHFIIADDREADDFAYLISASTNLASFYYMRGSVEAGKRYLGRALRYIADDHIPSMRIEDLLSMVKPLARAGQDVSIFFDEIQRVMRYARTSFDAVPQIVEVAIEEGYYSHAENFISLMSSDTTKAKYYARLATAQLKESQRINPS
jgi:tetratricopeptide (TPR) repeat protein